MKRKILVVIVWIIILSTCGCESTIAEVEISEWDLRMIGFYEGWDQNITEGYTIGIIDIDTKVASDDQSVQVQHDELLEAVVRRLSNTCKTDVICLPENASEDELDTAIEIMIEKGIRVINISLGTSQRIEYSNELKKRIAQENVLIVCSGGNNVDGLLYPALCEESISVIGCDIYGNINKEMAGVNKMSFVMPGRHINVCQSYFSGTSLSAVYFSVISAAYIEENPDISIGEILAELQECCISGDEYTYGVVQLDVLFEREQ